jgi:excisionase family DNA binding protein
VTVGPLDAIEQALAEALTKALPVAVDQLATIGGPRAYTVAQVAGRLDVSETTVRRLIHDGHLAAVPHLNPTRVAAQALDEFLAGKR